MLSTAPAPGASPGRTARWVALLDAPDPKTRNAATEALSDPDMAGPTVRPAVIAALPTASPEAAGRLAVVLLRTLNWDPPASADPDVRRAFDKYALLSDDERCARVETLQGPAAVDAWVRVLSGDPSPAVRWSAANGLRLAFAAPELPADALPAIVAEANAAAARVADRTLALLDAPPDPAAYPTPAGNGPLLAAAAWACRSADPARADGLMGRALAIEAADPSAVRGQADFAYLWAADRAVDRGDFAAAADRYRGLAARTAWSAVEVPEGVANLIATQVDHGPFPGFADDLRVNRPYLPRPEMLYCMARLVARQGGLAGPAAGAALDTAALALGGPSPEAHWLAGLFLARHGWSAPAGRELRACLWLSDPGSPLAVNAYFALAGAAADAEDDAAAARYLEEALKRLPPGPIPRVDRYGQRSTWTEDQARAEVCWHRLRAAVTAGDRAAAVAETNTVLNLDATGGVLANDPGMAADLVPVLVDAGRADEADRCFTAAYDRLRAKVAAGPAEPMPKNNLAWLCARSDRHLDEADALSAEAVAAEPADAACLDTRAEVLCRLGRPAEAVALERRALSIKPDDGYMVRQLARFRAAAAAAAAK